MKILSRSIIRAFLLNGILLSGLWSLTVPIWQFPDEQAHFAQVQNYAELGESPDGLEDLSLEIYESERVLGTLRDERGINDYTYRPGFNIEYSNGLVGKEEKYINELEIETRTNYVKRESPRYPPLFYWLSTIGYKIFYTQGLFTRVLGVRFISVGIFGLIIWFGYKFASELFEDNEQLVLATTAMIGLHPMFMFVSSGINNDTLLNLFGLVILYLLMKMMNEGLSYGSIFGIGLAFALGALSKQLVFLLLPVILIVLLLSIIRRGKKKISLSRSFVVLGAGLLVMLLLARREGFWWPYWPKVTEASPGYGMSVFGLLSQQLSKLYRETLPWYWGVYRWLSLVLPINLIRLIKVLLGVSLIGLIKYIKEVSGNKRATRLEWKLAVLVVANLFYVSIFLLWDNFQTRHAGFGHGIQGRYFFSLLGSHMALMALGSWKLIQKLEIAKRFGAIFLGLMMVLNLFSLYWVLKSYYVVNNFNLFVSQLSQYKPVFAKWPWTGVYFVAWLLSLVSLISKVDKADKKV